MTILGFVFLTIATQPWLTTYILSHKMFSGVIAYGFFSAIVDGMPPPGPNSGVLYRWVHASLNALALNIITALTAFFPRIAQLLGRVPIAQPDPPAEPATGKLLQMPSQGSQTPPPAA